MPVLWACWPRAIAVETNSVTLQPRAKPCPPLAPTFIARLPSRIDPGRALRGVLRHFRAYPHIQGYILTSFVFFDQAANPGLEGIDPCLDGVEVSRLRCDPELALPAVIIDEAHRSFAPLVFGIRPVQDHGTQDVVAIDENVRLDDDVLPHRAFDGIFSRVNFRLDALDRGAANDYRFFVQLDFRGVQASFSEKISQTFGREFFLVPAGGLQVF